MVVLLNRVDFSLECFVFQFVKEMDVDFTIFFVWIYSLFVLCIILLHLYIFY